MEIEIINKLDRPTFYISANEFVKLGGKLIKGQKLYWSDTKEVEGEDIHVGYTKFAVVHDPRIKSNQLTVYNDTSKVYDVSSHSPYVKVKITSFMMPETKI